MNIYVGNLPHSVEDDDLKQIFSDVGTVQSAKVILDRFTNQSRGFGFVEMNDADGKKAIEELDDMEIENRNVSVSEARPKRDFNNDRRNSNNNRW